MSSSKVLGQISLDNWGEVKPNPPLYALERVSKIYKGPAEDLVIFNELDLIIDAGESIAVTGASGSGKSTLLHLLGTLDTPSCGSIVFSGSDLSWFNAEEKAAFRNRELGFVFQFHHLLPEFSTAENVAMQAIIGGMPKKKAIQKAYDALELVGLTGRRDQSVTTLSGGERQRAAIARALLNEPRVLLADEPTGNLDEITGRKIAELLLEINEKLHTTMVVVTHNLELASLMSRRLELRAGELYDRTP